MISNTSDDRAQWEKLMDRRNEINSAQNNLFNKAQKSIEQLTDRVHDLDEDLKAHKLRNGELRKENETLDARVQELERALSRYEVLYHVVFSRMVP